ncbi:hypothetical protein RHGRI_038023 [Rhododendron griersonianum]|uniref:Uncharacterized protein n=1 Tax=Rhododendron griersonianum TaxID=479676 RepID=A0AAV6HXF4_9ERIC|nr:hypothetical protein RHGRI_038023 [Rhododendron griersonianum]
MVGGRRTRHSHRPTAPASTTSGAASTSTSTSGHRRRSQICSAQHWRKQSTPHQGL